MAVTLGDQLPGLEQRYPWDLYAQVREVLPERRQLARGVIPYGSEHVLDRRLLEGHHVLFVLERTELGVEGEVLGQVPRRMPLLRPVHGRRLVDALEHADHDPLVELGRLSQVGALPVEVDLEEVGTALGASAHQLGREDLRETL